MRYWQWLLASVAVTAAPGDDSLPYDLEQPQNCDLSLLQYGFDFRPSATSLSVLLDTDRPAAPAQEKLNLQQLWNHLEQPGNATSTEASPGTVSIVTHCLVVVVVQYFAVSLAALGTQVVNQLQNKPGGPLERALQSVSGHVNLLPMVGVFLFAVNARADELTGSQKILYGLPGAWTGSAMSVAVLLGVIAMFVQIADEAHLGSHTSDDDAAHPHETMPRLLGVIQIITTSLQYVAIFVLVGSVILMQEPSKVVTTLGNIRSSTPVVCIINLTVQFVLVSAIRLGVLGLKAVHSRPPVDAFRIVAAPAEIARWSDEDSVLKQATDTAGAIQDIGPMLGVLFLCARLRLLRLHDTDQFGTWIETSFYVCTFGLLAETILAVLAISVRQPLVLVALCTTLRWVVLTTVNFGVLAIAFNTLTMTAPVGVVLPDFWDTEGPVLTLALIYFFVHVLYWLVESLERAMGETHPSVPRSVWIAPLERTLLVTKDVVMFCPMLCVLFLGTNMKAGEIMQLRNALPQPWVQDFMYLCMWSIIMQLVLVVMNGLFIESPIEATVSYSPAHFPILPREQKAKAEVFVTMIGQSVCLLALYTGVAGVIVGIFTMSYENVSVPG